MKLGLYGPEFCNKISGSLTIGLLFGRWLPNWSSRARHVPLTRVLGPNIYLSFILMYISHSVYFYVHSGPGVVGRSLHNRIWRRARGPTCSRLHAGASCWLSARHTGALLLSACLCCVCATPRGRTDDVQEKELRLFDRTSGALDCRSEAKR